MFRTSFGVLLESLHAVHIADKGPAFWRGKDVIWCLVSLLISLICIDISVIYDFDLDKITVCVCVHLCVQVCVNIITSIYLMYQMFASYSLILVIFQLF